MNVLKRIVRIFMYFIFTVGLFVLCLTGFSSDKLVVTNYSFKSSKAKENYKILVISDFHHRSINFPGTDLITEVHKENPTCIFMVGDMIDKEIPNLNEVTSLLDGIIGYPTYYVTGNHEKDAPLFNNFKNLLNLYGVKYIDDTFIDVPNTNIRVFGVHDPYFDYKNYNHFVVNYGKVESVLDSLKGHIENDKINILMAHRPELMELYSHYDFDFTVSGHSHGGQIILGGFSLFSLSGGTYNYACGEYTHNNKKLFVTAGLGYNSLLPIRVNCNPEIVTINI